MACQSYSPPAGKRGEWLFVAQALLLVGLVFPPEWFDSFSTAAGVAAIGGGAAYIYTGVRDLGGSLSPFPSPSKANELVTRGVYAVSRHPMYAGVLLGALGIDLVTASPTRFAITLVLNAVLHAKMEAEEKALLERYGDEYERYMAQTPRLFPPIPLLTPLLRAAVGQAADLVDAKVAVDSNGGPQKSEDE